MKITLAFLFLGTCLVLTNAKAIQKKPMHESESFSHARMISISLKRWRDWQECDYKCSPVEKSCKLRAIVSDSFLILRIMANDFGIGIRKLLSVKTEIKISYLIECMEKYDHESFAIYLEQKSLLNSFMQVMCKLTKDSTDKAGLNFVLILRNVLGDAVDRIFSLFPEIIGEVLGVVGNLVDGLVGTATGLLSGLTDVKKGGYLGRG